MGFPKNRKFFTVPLLIFGFWFSLRFGQLEGVRILKGDLQSLMEKEEELLLLPALPRGKPPGSTSSPCTYIPGQNKGGKCTLKEMNVAGRRGGQGGHVVVPPTVLSELTVEVGGPDSASEDENGNAKRSS